MIIVLKELFISEKQTDYKEKKLQFPIFSFLSFFLLCFLEKKNFFIKSLHNFYHDNEKYK